MYYYCSTCIIHVQVMWIEYTGQFWLPLAPPVAPDRKSYSNRHKNCNDDKKSNNDYWNYGCQANVPRYARTDCSGVDICVYIVYVSHNYTLYYYCEKLTSSPGPFPTLYNNENWWKGGGTMRPGKLPGHAEPVGAILLLSLLLSMPCTHTVTVAGDGNIVL